MKKDDENKLREIIREELSRTNGVELFTAEQAGKLLKIKTGTLANWRSRGVGPKYTKFGELVRYSFAELQKHIADNSI